MKQRGYNYEKNHCTYSIFIMKKLLIVSLACYLNAGAMQVPDHTTQNVPDAFLQMLEKREASLQNKAQKISDYLEKIKQTAQLIDSSKNMYLFASHRHVVENDAHSAFITWMMCREKSTDHIIKLLSTVKSATYIMDHFPELDYENRKKEIDLYTNAYEELRAIAASEQWQNDPSYYLAVNYLNWVYTKEKEKSQNNNHRKNIER